MRRLAALTITAVLLLALFTGCGTLENAELVEHRCGNLSIELPDYFSDRTQDNSESITDQNTFIFTFQDMSIMGIEEPFDLFEGDVNMSLEEYAQRVIDGNNLEDCTIQNKDGYVYFTTYNETNRGKGTTWLVVVLRSETAFWLIEASCSDIHYVDNEADFWQYIRSISFDKPEPTEPEPTAPES